MYCILLTNAYYHGNTKLSSGWRVKPQEPVPTIGARRGAEPFCVSCIPQDRRSASGGVGVRGLSVGSGRALRPRLSAPDTAHRANGD